MIKSSTLAGLNLLFFYGLTHREYTSIVRIVKIFPSSFSFPSFF